MSHSLHGPVLAVVRARPANVLADVERHGFDFAGGPPACPGKYEPVGIIYQIKAACAGGEGLAATAIGERGHFPVPFLVRDMVIDGRFVMSMLQIWAWGTHHSNE
ncbi:hypothetical protein RHE_CH02524 [Rhizobium etli CFN 42]|uniref:Uncharacterized protein n=1 Tax=Rhizobium etli (strain ATCC 51251 / DSM 11541 / JCM 21823 / NBRC 15573 / CFN 42) TaxID=347834 RepID=Q2K787_RHIEC|nr:hypothetical protein RHE_CH02524 [Rhizobium etli CFN 42]